MHHCPAEDMRGCTAAALQTSSLKLSCLWSVSWLLSHHVDLFSSDVVWDAVFSVVL